MAVKRKNQAKSSVKKTATEKKTARMKKTVSVKSNEVKKKISPEKIVPAPKEFDFTMNKLSQYISERAYYLWEEEGMPEGRDWELWTRAEKDILTSLIRKR